MVNQEEKYEDLPRADGTVRLPGILSFQLQFPFFVIFDKQARTVIAPAGTSQQVLLEEVYGPVTMYAIKTVNMRLWIRRDPVS
jgi:hypothetical protein